MSKAKENIINVTELSTPGTKDNDIFQISHATPDKAVISPQYATDTLKFMSKLDEIDAELSGKDLVISYGYTESETHYSKTLTIKDYFTSEKGTATKSSLKNLIYTDIYDEVEKTLSVSTEVPIERPLIMYQKKSNKIIGTNFADVINLTKYVSDLHAVSGGKGNDVITGSKTADTISGDAGDDYIMGMEGNDTITGGKGNNTYAYNIGSTDNGYDVINLTKGETANIFYADYTDDAAYLLDGDGNAIIEFDTTKANRGAVLLNGFAKKDITNEANLQVWEYDAELDKMVIGTKDLKTDVTWEYTASDDYKGSYLNEHIDATGITEAKKNKRGKEIAYTFNGGKGNDTIEASFFADKVTGGAGKNTYLYSKNSESYSFLDQINGDKITLTKGENALIDIGGLTATGYEVVGKDLVVTVTDGVDEASFTIVNFGTKDVTNNKTKKVEDTSYVILNDSTTVDEGSIDLRYEVMVKSDKGTFHNDYIDKSASKKGVTIKGGAGDDTIIGTDKKDTIKAGTGDYENITGGKGNDKLYASTTEHSETKFYFNAGDGKDTVYSGNGVVQDEDTGDTLVFNNLSFGDMEFKTSKNDLIINYTDKDSVTVKNYFKKTSVKNITALEGTLAIEELMDPNKTVHVKGTQTVTGSDVTIIGSNDADTITSTGSNNRIITRDGNDTIYSGTGTNTVNAGKGVNTIHNKDGFDIIVNGGGTDTIVLDGETDLSDLEFDVEANGKDLTVWNSNDVVVTFEDYMTTDDHSAKYIQAGEEKVAIKDFRNDMSYMIENDKIDATNWQDDIYTNKLNAIIDAKGGNDIIHIDDGSKYPDVYVGEGDDEVRLETTGSNKPNVDIYFNNGDGNNTLSGLNDTTNTDTEINLHSLSLVHSIYLGGEMGENGFYSYVEGAYDSNDLILKLSDGETFTIKNYNYVEQPVKDTIKIYPNTTIYSQKLSDYKRFSEIVDIPYGESSYNCTENDGRLFLAESQGTNPSRTATFNNGSYFDVVVVGENNQTVNFNDVDYSNVYVYNKGLSTETANQSNVNVSGEANDIYIDGQVDVNVTVDGIDNGVHIYDCRQCNVTTSEGSSSSVYINKTNDDIYSSTVTSNGSDDIEIYGGKSNIKLNGEYSKYVTFNENANVSRISGIVDSDSVNITRTLSDDTDFADVMFEHYSDGSGSTENDLYIRYVDENVNVLNSNNTVTLVGKGGMQGNYNLDTDDVAQNVKITVTNVSETKKVSKKLGEITQYVNLNHGRYNNVLDFTNSAQSYLLEHRAGAYIYGTIDNDTYKDYSFSDGKVAINDLGGTGDKLSLDMYTNNCNFFIDFYDNGNVVSNSDLIIFNDTDKSVSDGLYNYLGYGGHEGELDYISEYVQIKNGFSGNSYSGAGAIETISATKEDDDDEFKFNVNSYVNAIKSNIASWMWDYNHDHVGLDCNTVSEALSYGLSAAERDSLYAIYNNGAANQWS